MYNVVKVVQDKVSPETVGRTMHCQLVEGPLTCLSVNRECSQVVAAGRNVFKVFTIGEEKFIEKCNLRVGKNLNLNYSASDVVWNPIEDHLLASAATNGAVVVWNLNKPSRSKQEIVFLEHRRTVHKVCFHGTESNLLLSGAQDGLIILFDLRKKGVASAFNRGKLECVRDVQFSPFHYFLFAAAYENGNFQLWDMRNPSRYERQFPAHNGPTFAIDWHPQERYWIGTAGRDRLIKVWDVQNSSSSKSIYSVQTTDSVASIKWRPQRQYHIASCSLLLDFSINVWDVRRPYIPFASFNEHKDIVTGIVWKHNDPHLFLSSSRDSTIYQHMFRDATRPADNANPVGVDISLAGNVAHASCDKLIATPGSRGGFKMPPIFRRPPDRAEQFTTVSSTLSEFDAALEALQMDWFVESAKSYKLSGCTLPELCDHNAKVAQNLGRVQVAQTWVMLKLMYGAAATAPASTTQTNKSSGGRSGHLADPLETNAERGKNTSKQHHDSKSSKNNDSDMKDMTADTSTGVSDEESDIPDGEAVPDNNMTHIASGVGNNNQNDYFFCDGDCDPPGFEFDALGTLENGLEWDLPSEAFEPRHGIVERGNPLPDTKPPLPGSTADPGAGSGSSSTAQHTGPGSGLNVGRPKVNLIGDRAVREEILGVRPFIANLPVLDFTDLVVNMMREYAEKGDVQMAVTVLIILDEKVRKHVDDITQVQWLTSYIDMLGRFQLWTVATAVIKLSRHPAVGQINMQSTRLQTNCSKCMKPQPRVGWLCERCKGLIKVCSICHLPVKGLYVWCQGCSHGGHLQHIREWFSDHRQCPAGCGHLCEYT